MTNETNKGHAPVPVYVLTGFLGSGKTTLLTRLLERLKSGGLQPAVIMNELGDINLDGQLVEGGVPMAELLSGCICCSMRGDLGLEIDGLMRKHRPGAIVIEATGAANPMELLDGVTEAALYRPVELKSVIAVVDGPQLLDRSRDGKGRTFKLMRDQIRCGTALLLNKSDRLAPEELVEAQQLLRDMNAYAPIIPTVRCETEEWDRLLGGTGEMIIEAGAAGGRSSDHETEGNRHHSHSHVMAVTHYLRGPVDSEAFERLLNGLPSDIYRAKGIVSFSDTSSGSRFLFQYAYKETDFIRIEPQGEVLDVAVFIGEHFSRELLIEKLRKLENGEVES
ncbi:GTP-binding protein [Paenibacillus sp. LHD-117]|uniref:CobW family GTP-binding protein n=1 Tax=Paenibacillus sp. LHD-117 TaxID=3071412 RepID=UPI0027DF610E|nr:GTP-binding protein [Paenibacillus sp. LHD-117]MDQ6422801.1 GTP-binding protein [Paenibacillus sp. LHD-117]